MEQYKIENLKGKKIALHCATKGELSQCAKVIGYADWSNEDTNKAWSKYNSCMCCISLKDSAYANAQSYIETGYVIIPASLFLLANAQPEPKPVEPIGWKVGDSIRKRAGTLNHIIEKIGDDSYHVDTVNWSTSKINSLIADGTWVIQPTEQPKWTKGQRFRVVQESFEHDERFIEGIYAQSIASGLYDFVCTKGINWKIGTQVIPWVDEVPLPENYMVVQNNEDKPELIIPIETKPVLFTTHDGVDMRKGDTYWCIQNRGTYNMWYGGDAGTGSGEDKSLLYFSTEQAAKSWIAEPQPQTNTRIPFNIELWKTGKYDAVYRDGSKPAHLYNNGNRTCTWMANGLDVVIHNECGEIINDYLDDFDLFLTHKAYISYCNIMLDGSPMNSETYTEGRKKENDIGMVRITTINNVKTIELIKTY